MARRPNEPPGYEGLVILTMVVVAVGAFGAVLYHSGIFAAKTVPQSVHLAQGGPTDALGRKSFTITNVSGNLAWSQVRVTLDGRVLDYADLVQTTPGWCIALAAGQPCMETGTYGAASLAVKSGQVLYVRGDPIVAHTVAVRMGNPDVELWSDKVAD